MPYKKPHHTSDERFVHATNGTFEIQPKGLNIVWGNDSRYWKIPEQGPAELIQVSWLEVSGVVKIKQNKRYAVKFDVKVKDDGFGWDSTEVLVMAKVGKKGKYAYKVLKLSPGTSLITEPLEVNVKDGDDLHFGLYEVWSGKWKGGLEINKAFVAPV